MNNLFLQAVFFVSQIILLHTIALPVFAEDTVQTLESREQSDSEILTGMDKPGRVENAPSAESENTAESNELQNSSSEDSAQATFPAEETAIAPPSSNLRSRDFGDAFKNFRPSEEISADNAVTFPVDI